MLKEVGERELQSDDRVVRAMALVVVAGVLCWLATVFGAQLRSDGISVFWPAAGVATFFIVFTSGLERAAALTGIIASWILGNIIGGRSLPVFLLFVAGNLAQPVLILLVRDQIALLIDGVTRGRASPEVRHALAFAIAAVAAVSGTAVFMAVALRQAGVAQDSFVTVWTQWAVSNLTGIAVVAPVAFAIHARVAEQGRNWTFRRALGIDVPWTVRQRLVMLVAVFAIPMMLLLVGAISYFAKLSRETQYRSVEFATKSMAQAIDARLSRYVVLGESLARSPALLEPDLTAFRAEIASIFEAKKTSWAVVSDAAGNQILNLRVPAGQPLPKRPPDGLEVHARAFATGRPQVSDVYIGPALKVWVVVIEVPIFKDGKPFRALSVVIDVVEFLELLNAPGMPRGWISGIADSKGRYVARVPDHQVRVGTSISKGWQAVLRKEGMAEMRSIEGDRVMNFNVNSQLGPWTIAIGARKHELEAAAWETVRWATLFGGSTSLVCILIAGAVARSILKPVERLGSSAAALVAGEPARFHGSLPEAQHLWTTLRNAVAARERTYAAEREATERVKLLIDEVNHRSKNLLSVVQSVVYHTAKDGDPVQFSQRLMDRINALSQSQNLLVENDWRDVQLQALIEKQLIHFKDTFGCRIQFQGPPVLLTAAATQTLGMAFNELATNAAKYGALSNDRGLIRIAWVWLYDGSSPRLRLTWTEKEGPPVQKPERRGFGYTVMVRAVEQALDATVALTYQPAGVVWEMIAPASQLTTANV